MEDDDWDTLEGDWAKESAAAYELINKIAAPDRTLMNAFQRPPAAVVESYTTLAAVMGVRNVNEWKDVKLWLKPREKVVFMKPFDEFDPKKVDVKGMEALKRYLQTYSENRPREMNW
eukprot:CAMPEP_0197845714 /NCGR_PEP_ID=MMETSP1438-20131217/2605_1 /TAXON_ID=1461541 /ORGANISM="Pterosperma sp., Strain CCMP1384" /LENGTH=116 /DNA_ID=CAMNT_0043457115 /DNA_START=233 /DNA_END=580 /DNA_ORIENTATION=-